jgi:hypothetical protein
MGASQDSVEEIEHTSTPPVAPHLKPNGGSHGNGMSQVSIRLGSSFMAKLGRLAPPTETSSLCRTC